MSDFTVYTAPDKVHVKLGAFDSLDDATDYFINTVAEMVDPEIDCISDHMTVITIEDTVYVVAENGYTPHHSDFALYSDDDNA